MADNMLKRGWVCDPVCRLCRVTDESCLHLFLKCPFSGQVWDLVQQKLQITFNPPPADAADLSLWWLHQISTRSKSAAPSLNAVITLVCWTIWKERNARTFNNVSATVPQVFSKIVEEAAVWHHEGRSKAGALGCRPREPD